MKGKTAMWLAAALAALAVLMMLTGGENAGSASQEERRIAEVLSAMAGAGRVEVALFYADENRTAFSSSVAVPTGAVVVAEGADDLRVRLTLIRAVRTLLGLPESAVDVFAMEDGIR